MQYYNEYQATHTDGYSLEQQVSAIMRKVYLRMFVGLLISAFVSLGVASSPAAMSFIYGHPVVYWGMFIGMLVMAFVIPARLMKMSPTTTLLLFCLFSALMGATLASIFYVYRIGTIVYTFFISAGVFGAMSVYGYFTKTNLMKYSTFFTMALFGLIIAIVVNLFLDSESLEWIFSIVGVLLFTGLTAWDTQQVKLLAQQNMAPQMTDKLATMGAMNLYLDFINLFLFLLRIFGGGRD